MASITVERVYATSASLASVKLKVDGRTVGRVKSGSAFVIEVTPGAHELRAHLHGTASNPLPVHLTDDAAEIVVELSTSDDPDRPESLGVWRGLRHPRSAFSLRVKSDH